ncbi:MAG: ATP-binding cassette domain-containing protein [Phycisphaerae bacterium]
MTTMENLRHGGHLYGLTSRKLQEQIDEALTALHVADRAKDLVKTLSGGLQRRVEIAKCLLHRPSLLILDEPSTGLDPRARKELWDYLKLLQRDHGMTLLLTTHYMEEAERCDRLALFDRGRLVICGSPDELKRRVGGDCVTIECADPPNLNDRIERELDCKAAVLNGAVRIETDSGPSIVTDVMNRFGDEIRSVTFGRPTLEDVFVHETGRRFEVASPAEESSDDE